MIEPMTARDLFTVAYGVFVVFGGLYVLSSVPMLLEYWRRGKQKDKR